MKIVEGNLTWLSSDNINETINTILLTKHNKSEPLVTIATELQTLSETLNESEEINSEKPTELLPSIFYSDSLANLTSGLKPTTEAIQDANTDYRFRWIDYRNRPAYPPRVPPLPGIPSGFRNPTTTRPPPKQLPSAPAHNPGFGGSSSNPVGFAGSIASSLGNGVSRRPLSNLTRVERKFQHTSVELNRIN